MDFTTLKAAVVSRGFSRLTTTEQGQVINDAIHELDGMEPRWPYLLTTSSGALPLTISDYVDVTLVMNTTLNVPVDYVDFEDFSAYAGDLTRTGTDPQFWYFTPGSTTSLSGYPVTARSVKVTYYKSSPDLSAGADLPLAPSRWHHLIVDMAVRNAYGLKSVDVPAALESAIGRKLAGMRTDLLYRQVQGPSMVLPMGAEDY